MNEDDKRKFQILLSEKDSESQSLRNEMRDMSEKVDHLSEENYTLRNQIQPKEPWVQTASDRSSQQNELVSELRQEKRDLQKELERLRAKTLKKEIKIAKLEKENDLLKTLSEKPEKAAAISSQFANPNNKHMSFSRHASVDRRIQIQHLLTSESLNMKEPSCIANAGLNMRIPSTKKFVGSSVANSRKNNGIPEAHEVALHHLDIARPQSDKNRKLEGSITMQRNPKE